MMPRVVIVILLRVVRLISLRLRCRLTPPSIYYKAADARRRAYCYFRASAPAAADVYAACFSVDDVCRHAATLRYAMLATPCLSPLRASHVTMLTMLMPYDAAVGVQR